MVLCNECKPMGNVACFMELRLWKIKKDAKIANKTALKMLSFIGCSEGNCNDKGRCANDGPKGCRSRNAGILICVGDYDKSFSINYANAKFWNIYHAYLSLLSCHPISNYNCCPWVRKYTDTNFCSPILLVCSKLIIIFNLESSFDSKTLNSWWNLQLGGNTEAFFGGGGRVGLVRRSAITTVIKHLKSSWESV